MNSDNFSVCLYFVYMHFVEKESVRSERDREGKSEREREEKSERDKTFLFIYIFTCGCLFFTFLNMCIVFVYYLSDHLFN